MNPNRFFVIGTAGHIDHGKTALVRALTGIDTDRLPEEKRRGITIDLGYASLDVMGPDDTVLRIGFVDVPGHALFIRNMLAGAGCVPAVMLVIAADEGVMPQTREHLAICQLLGISDGFTVITKSDLVTESQIAEIRNQIAAFLEDTFLDAKEHAIIAASAHKGSGLEKIRLELTSLALHAQVAERSRPMRLPIDRTFVKKGFGTVVTGTLLSGEIRTGESLMLEPGARTVRVRGLQTHRESEEMACPGSRVAVNLSGVDATEVSRGQTLVVPETLTATDTIDAEITLLGDAPFLKHRARVHFHAFTSEVMATVSLYSSEPVQSGATRIARLRLASAIVLSPGDRFVLRQSLPAGTIGGGRILDAQPLVHGRKSEVGSWLERLARASVQERLILRIQRRGTQGIAVDVLAREMGLTIVAVSELASGLLQAGEILHLSDDLFVSRDAFARVSEQALARFRLSGPAGLKRSELQSQTGLRAEIISAVLDRLTAEGRVQFKNEVVSPAGAAPAISGKETEALRAVSAAYRSAGLAGPTVGELAQRLRIPENEMRRHITLLIRDKTLVRMGNDNAFVHAEALSELAARLAPMRGKAIDVSAFKTMTGLTRKHAIPLLEYLDRERITRKQGDARIVL